MGTSVRPANGAHRRIWGQPSGAYRGMIQSEGGYLREASRQTPTGEGAASRQAPIYERETSVGPAIWRPHEKVRPAVRHPQDIVRPAIAALTVRSAIGAHKKFSESFHAALTMRRPSRRSQNISVACYCGANSEACHRALTIYHKIKYPSTDYS